MHLSTPSTRTISVRRDPASLHLLRNQFATPQSCRQNLRQDRPIPELEPRLIKPLPINQVQPQTHQNLFQLLQREQLSSLIPHVKNHAVAKRFVEILYAHFGVRNLLQDKQLSCKTGLGSQTGRFAPGIRAATQSRYQIGRINSEMYVRKPSSSTGNKSSPPAGPASSIAWST